MPVTDDPNDPRLHYGVDEERTLQHDTYLVLSDEERGRGFVRPVRRTYIHSIAANTAGCGSTTIMSQTIAETYARDPKFYGSTYCMLCQKHLPVSEFVWDEPERRVVGS